MTICGTDRSVIVSDAWKIFTGARPRSWRTARASPSTALTTHAPDAILSVTTPPRSRSATVALIGDTSGARLGGQAGFGRPLGFLAHPRADPEASLEPASQQADRKDQDQVERRQHEVHLHRLKRLGHQDRRRQ